MSSVALQDLSFSTQELEQIRADTPAADEVLHFDNAGASLMPLPVSEYLHDYLRLEERVGGYRAQALRAADLERFYTAAAGLLNCHTDEIAFADNATRAWDMVFYAFQFQPGDRVLTSVADYGSNYVAYLQQAKRLGVEICIVPNDDDGVIDVEQLRAMLDERVKLISVSHIPTGGGLINPVVEIGRLARQHGVPFLLDACQSIGQLPVDVQAIGCDMACGTGRKYLRGPRGTGLLYVRREWIQQLEPPILDQRAADLLSAHEYRIRDDAGRFETWEQFCAGKAALARAMDYANHWGMARIAQRLQDLAEQLRTALNQVAGVTVMDQGRERCGIVTFQARQQSAYAIKHALATESIHVSVSEGSGSLVAFQQRGIQQLVRASVHYFNRRQEVDRFVYVLSKFLHA